MLEKVNFKKLKYLNLKENMISDIAPINKANFKQLKELNLKYNSILNIEEIMELRIINSRKLKN